MRRKEKFVHIALGSLIVMVGLLAMGSFSLAKAEGTWATRTDMPTARWEPSTSVVDGKIYAIGGAGPVWQPLRTVEAYDPATDTWTTKSEMPTARAGLSTNVVNGKIYAIGGGAASGGSYSGAKTFSTVEAYDPATDTWTTKSEMPTARGFHSANVVDGRIYVIGGTAGPAYETSTCILTVEVYEPATDTWTQKGDIPASRGAGFTSVVDGKIYAMGGYGGARRVDEYDPVTDTWTEKADMPAWRVSLSTSVLDGKIYAIGGHPGSSPYPGKTTVDVYDPATDTWTTAPDMPTGRWGVRTSVVDGKIYAIGGLDRGLGLACGTVEEYDPARTVEVSPASAVADQPTPLEVTVVLGRPLEETETLRRMILDLSPLGIPDDLPLEHAGAGRYTLSTTVTPLRSGHCDVLILMETTEGKRYRFLTATLDVYPGGDEVLYQDEVGSRWEAEVSSAGTLDLTGSDVVHGGSYAQAITLPSGTLKYTYTDPDGLSTFGYTILEFWIHPGSSSTEQATLGLMATEGSHYLKLGYHLGITLQPNEWQVVSIPLEDLELVDTHLKEIELRGVVGTFYLDDLGLVAVEYGLEKALATPERIKADGTMQTLLTVQAVPAVPEPGAPPTVTIDLTPIGGAPDAVMTDDGTGGDQAAGDGLYTLRTTVDPAIENGRKELGITSTDRRLQVVRTHLFVEIYPDGDRILYEDGPGEGWTVQVARGESDLMSTTFVHSGSFSHAISPHPRLGVSVEYTLDDPEGIPPFGYTLEFWINGGEASGQDPVFGGRKLSGLGIVPQAGIWLSVSIPASQLMLDGGRLRSILISGLTEETFYIDDMKLVAMEPPEPEPVNVETSREGLLPSGYTLSQNYPNPFNPITTIAYDLPEATDVTLILYTVTGQKVAVLVDGHQDAGHHAVLFDGSGFGTGVYLYRLEAGGFRETRRMVLLK